MKAALFTKFPERFVTLSLLPKLVARGIDVVLRETAGRAGVLDLSGVDVVLHTFEYASHIEDAAVAGAAQRAGKRFVRLSRKASGWPKELQGEKPMQVTSEREHPMSRHAVSDGSLEPMLREYITLWETGRARSEICTTLGKYWGEGKTPDPHAVEVYIHTLREKRERCPQFFLDWWEQRMASPRIRPGQHPRHASSQPATDTLTAIANVEVPTGTALGMSKPHADANMLALFEEENTTLTAAVKRANEDVERLAFALTQRDTEVKDLNDKFLGSRALVSRLEEQVKNMRGAVDAADKRAAEASSEAARLRRTLNDRQAANPSPDKDLAERLARALERQNELETQAKTREGVVKQLHADLATRGAELQTALREVKMHRGGSLGQRLLPAAGTVEDLRGVLVPLLSLVKVGVLTADEALARVTAYVEKGGAK